MANVPNVQINIDNTSSVPAPTWSVESSYSDHFDLTGYAYNIPANTDESLITFGGGVGNNHQMTTSSVVTIGSTKYSCGPNNFTATTNMVVTYTFDGTQLTFSKS